MRKGEEKKREEHSVFTLNNALILLFQIWQLSISALLTDYKMSIMNQDNVHISLKLLSPSYREQTVLTLKGTVSTIQRTFKFYKQSSLQQSPSFPMRRQSLYITPTTRPNDTTKLNRHRAGDCLF